MGEAKKEGSNTLKSYNLPGGSSDFPNLAAFPELKWPEISKLLKEQEDYRIKERHTGQNIMQLREEIKQDQANYAKARREALRAGDPEPDYSLITAKEAELEKLEERSRDFRQIREENKAEIYAAVAAHREKYTPGLVEALAKKEATLEEQIEEVRETLSEVDALSRLVEWLEAPERGFAISPTNTTGLAAVVREARYRVAGSVVV
jgi:hypothetical protein